MMADSRMRGSNRFGRMTRYWTLGWLIFGVILVVIGVQSLVPPLIAGLWIGLWAAYPIVREVYYRGRMAGRQQADEEDSEE